MLRPVPMLLCLCAVMLAACAPWSTYYRAGGEVAQLDADLLDCEVSALRDAPVANRIHQSPPRYIPSRRYCDASGSCYSRGGYFERGDVFVFDANEDLRDRLMAQCMTQRGYERVKIPICSTEVQRKVPQAAMSRMPALTPQSCAIRYSNGDWQIIRTQN